MFFMFKNRITEHTLQSAGLMIDMVLYKGLWHSNQFTQWFGKHWGHGRGPDDSSPSKTSSQWPAWAGCANGSYFKNYPHTSIANHTFSKSQDNVWVRWLAIGWSTKIQLLAWTETFLCVTLPRSALAATQPLSQLESEAVFWDLAPGVWSWPFLSV
jgi:hypothetical protein